MKSNEDIRTEVREHYSAIARGTKSSCCGGGAGDVTTASRRLGYSEDELAAAPEGANLGLGCGNPQAIAGLKHGEVVIDLGSGGGFDAFLAARAVGPTGRVIGVDMSSDMLALARANAAKQGATNVEFRLGEIEHLPLPDASADVVISNCVVNLSPDKRAVYAEAFRALRPGGRVAISDVVALKPLPTAVANDLAALCGCIAGAAQVGELETLLREIGFADVRIEVEPLSAEVIAEWTPGSGHEQYVASAKIMATKPGAGTRADAGKKTAGACCAPGCCS
jgi:ubiquinone/menaquinone biosynthesis C-methylase UbiE